MKYYLAIHLCAGLLCAPYENPQPFDLITDCDKAAQEALAHVKTNPEAYRQLLDGAPGEVRVDVYACVARVG